MSSLGTGFISTENSLIISPAMGANDRRAHNLVRALLHVNPREASSPVEDRAIDLVSL